MQLQDVLKDRLSKLADEHRNLDHMIDHMLTEHVVNQIAVQRLKKRKLLIKDQMIKVSSQLIPDIIA